MFEYASEKLNDAHSALEILQTLVILPDESNIRFVSGPEGGSSDKVSIANPAAFSNAFSSCVYQIRAVGEAVLNVDKLKINGIRVKEKELNENNQLDVFRNWKKQKCNFHKSLGVGELLYFIHNYRIDDFHYGINSLAFTMYGHKFSTNGIGDKPSPDAEWFVNGKGVFWLVNKGTAKERCIPCKIKVGLSFDVTIINPPMFHLGKVLTSTDPISICKTALNYYEEFLFEAKNNFWD